MSTMRARNTAREGSPNSRSAPFYSLNSTPSPSQSRPRSASPSSGALKQGNAPPPSSRPGQGSWVGSLIAAALHPMRGYRDEHDKFVVYQRALPFKTVVPEPPSRLREQLAACVWHGFIRVITIVFFILASPLLLALHLVLTWLDRRQRRSWLAFQMAWPFHSVPHVRPVRYAADDRYPLDDWHLCCEDGRQRWYWEAKSSGVEHVRFNEEEGNVLGRAQLAGMPSVASYEQFMRHKSPASAEEAAALIKTDVLSTKLMQRRWLEQYQLGLTEENAQTKPNPRPTPEAAMDDGIKFLLRLQDPFSGHWPNDYSGCMFLTPGLIFAQFIMAKGRVDRMFAAQPLHNVSPSPSPTKDTAPSAAADAMCGGEATRLELVRYFRNYQNEDGGWGQHTEGHSTMLGTVLTYVSMRLLGIAATDAQLVKSREWILAEGGAVSTPMWGKVWLCILGVYSWDGVNPLPPELLLLPSWIPFSEGRAWCHSRVIAIPFQYFFGLRWKSPDYPVLAAIRKEIYAQPYEQIDWRACRDLVSSRDLYTPTSTFFKFVMKCLDLYERRPLRFLRRYALEKSWRHMAYDDENTHFICLGPVNKSLNMLVTWIREGEHSVRFQHHKERVDDYLFMGSTGLRMNGYNGSQLWDTSFAVQAICACQREMLFPNELNLAHHYIDIAQVQEDPIAADYFFRHRTKGAWNFSTSPQGWQVSDCTAEGLRVILLLPHLPFPVSRVYDAVDEVLSLRNVGGDGGWASYEASRAPYYCELFDCAELFKDVMVEYSYTECSSSCIHSLALFRQQYPEYRRGDVDRAVSEGIACVLGKQRPDGSFYGSWAVCFTYAAWLVADALRASGELTDMANHPHCMRLVDFLLQHQNADGGWGEDVNACVRQVWVDNADGSQVVNTAWAVMAIMCAAGSARKTSLPRRRRLIQAVERGVQFIMSRQLESGDWAQERISGVFNGNNPIHYPGYKNTMTVWALGKYNTEWKQNYVA